MVLVQPIVETQPSFKSRIPSLSSSISSSKSRHPSWSASLCELDAQPSDSPIPSGQKSRSSGMPSPSMSLFASMRILVFLESSVIVYSPHSAVVVTKKLSVLKSRSVRIYEKDPSFWRGSMLLVSERSSSMI